MASKFQNVTGTRDFSPIEMARRNYIIDTIKSAFLNFGFQQIETPALENLNTLTGKYGEEGDRLIYKILNSGDFLKKVNADDIAAADSVKVLPQLSEKALRYDLTVPFARYVVQHQSEFTLPFKRFQIQPVWRADRPQKGRYREFYQCDADVVGAKSHFQEVELLQIYLRVFENLGLPVTIKINHRGILTALAHYLDAADQATAIITAIDKLDKIGIEKVLAEIGALGVTADKLAALRVLLSPSSESNAEKMNSVAATLGTDAHAALAITELTAIFELLAKVASKNATNVAFDITLARGLNYYTGAIFEVQAHGAGLGSIGGGGRYDDLTGIFGLPNLPGIGISFGLDRIYLALEILDLFPKENEQHIRVLFVNFGGAAAEYAFEIATHLRNENIACEMYPTSAKIKKQFDYANKNNIPYVAIAGEEEVAHQTIVLKNMATGAQESVPKNGLSLVIK